MENLYHRQPKTHITKRSFLTLILGGALFSGVATAAPSAPTPSELCASSAKGENCVAHAEAPKFTPTPNPTGSARKASGKCFTPGHFHPGYYVHGGLSTKKKPMPSSAIKRLNQNPQFRGHRQFYFWRDLEPQKGKYDFSLIDKDLSKIKSVKGGDKQLFIYIAVWGSSQPGTPRYMWNDKSYGCDSTNYGNYKFGKIKSGRKWNACFWNNNLQQRWAALFKALGAKYNNHPNFEGVTLIETSQNIDGAKKFGHTSEGLKGPFLNMYKSAKKAFPKRTVMGWINYANYDLNDFVKQVTNACIGIGGPDLPLDLTPGKLPHHLYKAYSNKVPVGPDVAWDNYERKNRATGKKPKAIDFIKYAQGQTNPWYMFFHPRSPYFEADVVPTTARTKLY